MGSVTPTPSSRLFQPLKLGNTHVAHRIAMAPLTRHRADDAHFPTDIMREYYTQRAATRGTLIVTEASYMSPLQGGLANAPGIYNQAQIDAWREIVHAVHARESFIFSQLWAIGRAAKPEVGAREGFVPKTSSAVLSGELNGDWDGSSPSTSGKHVVPQAMAIEEIKQTVQAYAQAARNAMVAGFDGVEIHAANGYLIDQSTQDVVNQRTDAYGGECREPVTICGRGG
jgi:NADPH2 dehydrogenase